MKSNIINTKELIYIKIEWICEKCGKNNSGSDIQLLHVCNNCKIVYAIFTNENGEILNTKEVKINNN